MHIPSIIHRVRLFVPLLVLILFSLTFRPISTLAEELIVVGTGDSQSLLRLLGEAFERLHPEDHIIIPDSIGSSGGIRAVASNKYVLGRTARPLSAQEKSFGLSTLVFGYSAIAFIVNKSVTGVENLTSEQLIAIFHGDITNWSQLGGPNQKIYLVNRETGDSSQQVLCREIPGFTNIKKIPGPTFFSTLEAIDALGRHSYTIGYAPLSMIQPTKMRPLLYNAITPSAHNIANGSYPLSTPLGLVWKGILPPAYQRFVDFVLSADASRMMVNSGIQPAKGL